MDKLIKDIIKSKLDCYFISPHLDDAALSCGSLLEKLAKKTNVAVINVFTKAGNTNSFSARKALSIHGFKNSKEYYKVRVNEDLKAYTSLGVKVINLGYTEALWREKKRTGTFSKILSFVLPEAKLLYPTFRFNILKGKLAKEDFELVELLQRKIGNLNRNAIIFAPLSIGSHVDHKLVYESTKNFRNVVYWSDFPYNLGSKEKPTLGGKKIFKTGKSKKVLLAHYKTQFSLLFPKGMPKVNEFYYLK